MPAWTGASPTRGASMAEPSTVVSWSPTAGDLDGGDLDGGDLDGGDLDASIDAGIAPMDAAVPIDAFSADASGDVLDRDAENDAASPDAGGVVIEGGCACRAHASSGRTSLLSLAFGLVLCLRLGRRRARFGGRR
jgi:hypothetical protein